jgi:type II secretory pathway component PulF
MPHGRLRSSLFALARSLESGASVGEAVAGLGGRVPGHLLGLVEIGSRTGRLSEVLGRFVAFQTAGAEARRKVTINLAYPMTALFLAMAIYVLVCSLLVGLIEGVFKDFGVAMPGVSLLILRVARVFRVGWRPLVEGVIGVLGFWLLARAVLGERLRRGLLGGVPLVGAVWRNTSLAEFCQLLTLLLESEVPLPRALRLTAEGVEDVSVERVCHAVAADVEGGRPLSEAVALHPVFPPGLSRLLRWAEGERTLPGALQMAGEMYAARARAQASFAGTVLSVLAVLAILGGLLAVVLGLFLPLYTLISKLAG